MPPKGIRSITPLHALLPLLPVLFFISKSLGPVFYNICLSSFFLLIFLPSPRSRPLFFLMPLMGVDGIDRPRVLNLMNPGAPRLTREDPPQDKFMEIVPFSMLGLYLQVICDSYTDQTDKAVSMCYSDLSLEN